MDKTMRKQRELSLLEQYGGIFPPFAAFYIQSIIYAAESSKDAFENFDITVSKSAPDGIIVAIMQEALNHAGALSRFFWPSNKDSALHVARGKRLCEAFCLDDNSPLRWRKLRNAFEHYDENLDHFLLQDISGTCFPQPLVGDYALVEELIDITFKFVDPKRNICILLGEKFEYQPIRNEVCRVLAHALEMDNQGARLSLQ